jgi:hypothetical protein
MTVPYGQVPPRLHPARLDGEKDWQLIPSVVPSLFLVRSRRDAAAPDEERYRERASALAVNRRFHRTQGRWRRSKAESHSSVAPKLRARGRESRMYSGFTTRCAALRRRGGRRDPCVLPGAVLRDQRAIRSRRSVEIGLAPLLLGTAITGLSFLDQMEQLFGNGQAVRHIGLESLCTRKLFRLSQVFSGRSNWSEVEPRRNLVRLLVCGRFQNDAV